MKWEDFPHCPSCSAEVSDVDVLYLVPQGADLRITFKCNGEANMATGKNTIYTDTETYETMVWCPARGEP